MNNKLKIDVKKMGCEDRRLIELDQDGVLWWGWILTMLTREVML
jgi:hypothetical protein